ncbi:sucrose non-fermenting protein kinase 1 [Colletotrichum liriopes]|uniref:non-specific serine/threonine protein kinase n=1 Tax=Colletotrichum liriopes TaxID=708192 RepID=A0AA37GEK2_9PEZI|nr:sucrose non-fermenting protein kinase 1 [Colletotrichum liriopes]
MASGFDEEELHISLSPSQIRRRSQQHGAAADAAAAAGRHELQPPLPDAINAANMGPPVDTTAPLRDKIKTEQRIGAYKIIKTLGEGSFGKVKLAIHNGTGQQVALKIIARKKLISRDMAGRVEREIEYLQLLRHPHIIKLYTVIKTPNEIIMVLEYAGAPEVIGGKLYAGPEVDVWSCGVILYVLLVGRLPFDDEHIPSLFAKIARGTYSIPQWMNSGAATLIKKMLVVNPVQRATIDDIRQDPWFMIDLPAYLAPPVEEFFNTGVDPNKAIQKSDIAPNAPPRVQEKLHNEVTEKISKTMGYGKKDVEEALQAAEPSAIKDAYMIVRENKLMQVNEAMSSLSVDQDGSSSPLPSASSARSGGSTVGGQRPYISKIGILPSSLPAYHKEYIEREKGGFEDHPTPTIVVDEPGLSARTDAEREETARHLKPHSRNSQVRLDDSAKRPQGMTPVVQAKKTKPVRWQFGIRSRNAPWEALLCIHKALNKLGATYVPDEDYEKVHGAETDQPSNEGSFVDDYASQGGNDSTSSIDPLKRYKLPADPWHIKGSKTPDSYHVVGDDEVKRDFVALHMDIQIYEMEHGVYLVDFKCSGYETADRRLLEEKDVTSPFPFLDMAARLIMQLAEAD